MTEEEIDALLEEQAAKALARLELHVKMTTATFRNSDDADKLVVVEVKE